MSDRESPPDAEAESGPDPASDDATAPDDYRSYRMPFEEPLAEPETSSDGDVESGSDATSDADAAPDADHTYRMPFTVRAAQVLAVGLAAIGLGCAVSAWWLSGFHAALVTGASFVASWLLGLVALTFGAEGDRIRATAVLLAILNGLWTVPSIILGRPPGWLGPAVSIVVIGLLLPRSARDWFEP
ncbi:putative membrane protein [Nocardia nova SH22a]|uniref:Putative membrane protein n=1 Tax=Nocardia nova SH22a TaxID=1415166 RepID=W5TXE0_9NOCA|nr:hypothetical protein [Nocardia nova]AHH21861.1 putative membrane protein [Nocardia nova SH22a]